MTTISKEDARQECERQVAEIFAYVDDLQAMLDGSRRSVRDEAGQRAVW
jgi:hypothetical protein